MSHTNEQGPVRDSEPNSGPSRLLASVAPRVFFPAFLFLLAVVLAAIIFPEDLDTAFSSAQDWVIKSFGWWYVAVATAFVVFALWLGLSRFGDIKLGKDSDEPDFSVWAWFSMLFAAGMGIGLVFYGAAEPLTFFESPKPGIDGNQAELASDAMAQTFLHWGFHAWAIYVVIGLAVAYSVHRKGRPSSIRWALEPLLGDRVNGWIGDAIDILAVVGTVAGVATSLGIGVNQISGGLEHLGVTDSTSDGLKVLLIAIITGCAVLSVVSGVGKGIKWLSNTNLIVAGLFLVAMLALGSTSFLMRDFVESVGAYFQDLIGLSFDTSTYTGSDGLSWQGGWTMFYWGWWMSWAPFVGVFIARISKGRTVREFVAGVLLVPTSVTFLWFSVMGGSAIWERMVNDGDLSAYDASGQYVAEFVLFDLVDTLPLSGLLSVVIIFLVAVFFVTSSDSGSLVVDMLASGGETDPPKWSRVLWATIEGLVAASLLLVGAEGLNALKTGAILIALPFSLVLVAMCIATYKAMHAEHRLLVRAQRRQQREELERQVGDNVTGELTENFDEHLAEPVEEHVEKVLIRRDNDKDHRPR